MSHQVQLQHRGCGVVRQAGWFRALLLQSMTALAFGSEAVCGDPACFSTPGLGLQGPTAAFEGLCDREQKTLPEACYAAPVWQTARCYRHCELQTLSEFGAQANLTRGIEGDDRFDGLYTLIVIAIVPQVPRFCHTLCKIFRHEAGLRCARLASRGWQAGCNSG